jgi:hypothetical protein
MGHPPSPKAILVRSMDGAYRVRDAWRRVLLASLLIQVMTPDVLDLSLLSQALPPAPIFVVTSLSAPDSLAEPSSMDDREHGDTGDLCEPFWPEVGLARDRSLGPVSRTRPGAGPTIGLPFPQGDPARLFLPMIPVGRIARPSLYCRLTC